MYADHFGFKILPFENVPDPMFFFEEGDYSSVRNRLTDSLKAGRGLIVVLGPMGSGKTTLSQMIKSDLSDDVRVIWMAEPPGNSLELFLFIAQELGLKPSTVERTFVIRDIRTNLLKINSEGRKCLVIIDESHLMTDEVVFGIRLLNNLEEGSTKLIQILLLGQPELMETINKPGLEPFKQRIATLEILGKMNADGILKYIKHRLQVAGGHPSIFSDTGWEALFLAFGSGCTPRIINSFCDRILAVAIERKKTIVDAHDVFEAARGMDMSKDILNYVLQLRDREGRKQLPVAMEDDSLNEPETQGTVPVQTDFGRNDKHSGVSQSTQKGSKHGFSVSRANQKGLRMPILFLLLSMVTLIFSIFFYYERSGYPEPMTLFQELTKYLLTCSSQLF
jgi:general secretion pathway protein A